MTSCAIKMPPRRTPLSGQTERRLHVSGPLLIPVGVALIVGLIAPRGGAIRRQISPTVGGRRVCCLGVGQSLVVGLRYIAAPCAVRGCLVRRRGRRCNAGL